MEVLKDTDIHLGLKFVWSLTNLVAGTKVKWLVPEKKVDAKTTLQRNQKIMSLSQICLEFFHSRPERKSKLVKNLLKDALFKLELAWCSTIRTARA